MACISRYGVKSLQQINCTTNHNRRLNISRVLRAILVQFLCLYRLRAFDHSCLVS